MLLSMVGAVHSLYMVIDVIYHSCQPTEADGPVSLW
jgi:hypothetical protein